MGLMCDDVIQFLLANSLRTRCTVSLQLMFQTHTNSWLQGAQFLKEKQAQIIIPLPLCLAVVLRRLWFVQSLRCSSKRFFFFCNSSYFGVNLSLLGRMAAILNASPFRIMDLTWFGNGFKILLRLMGSKNCVTKMHHCHRPECTSLAKCQSLCFYRGAHTSWWSVNQVCLISSAWQWLCLLGAVGEVRVW